jgi:hypothetical protein
MPLSTFSGLSSLADVVPSERIVETIQAAALPPVVAEMVAWIEDCPPGAGNTIQWPRWAATTVPSGTKGETEAFDAVSMATDSETVQVAFVGMDVPLSDEASHDGAGLPQGLLIEGVRAVRDRVDSDVLATIATATNSEDFTGSPLNLQRWGATAAVFRALSPPSEQGFAAILHTHQLDTLLADMRLTAATLMPATADQRLFGAASGPVGFYENIAVFATTNAPVNGGVYSAAFTPIGNGASALGLAIAEPVGVELQRDAVRKVTHAVFSARFGAVVVIQGRLVEALTG